MKTLKVLMIALLCAVIMLASFAVAEQNLGSIKSISIKVLPKTEYLVGESFTTEGGVLTVEYENGSIDVPMDDPNVELKEPNTSRAGSKTVQIKYGGKKVSFKIAVSLPGMSFRFDMNDGSSNSVEQMVVKGNMVQRIEDPQRDGYTFYNWYCDPECTRLYDFSTIIQEETTIYAFWKKNDTQHFTVTFDLNYYGCKNPTVKEIVATGNPARPLSIVPERTDYVFSAWTTDAAGAEAYDFASPVASDMILYAQWEKTKTAPSLYVFEAEDVDLSQKAGPGYSGENAGSAMAIVNKKVSASQDMFVAYQCKNGNSLEFYLASDSDASANLIVRFAAEFSDMVINSNKYQVSVNGKAIEYPDVFLALTEGSQQGQFMDIDLHEVQLQKGSNLIQLKTINDEALGGTLTATAPIIDCIKLETEAVVIWDGTYGLPSKNY